MKIKSVLSMSFAAGLLCLCAAEATAGSGFGDVGEFVAGGAATGAAARNLIYFRLSGTPVYATCPSGATATHFVINADEGGNTIVSTLLAAKLAGKKVHVAGKGTCNIISGMEDVSYVYLD